MAKLPTMFTARHLLVLSLALNVSLILKMAYVSEVGSCLKKTKAVAEERRIIYKSRLAMPSSSSSSAYSTRTNHPQGKDRVINLDQGLRLRYCALRPALVSGKDRDMSSSL